MYPIRKLVFTDDVSPTGGRRPAYDGDSANISAVRLSPGQNRIIGPHPGDSAWYILRGEATADPPEPTTSLAANSVLFLPRNVEVRLYAGDGGVDLLQVITKVMFGVSETSVGASARPSRGVEATNAAPFHATVSQALTQSTVVVDRLVTQERGSADLHVYCAHMPSGCGTGPMHIHPFDQFQVVLSGEATVRIGLDSYKLGPMNMAVLPAGVPHMVLNESASPEQHIGINVGDPLPIRTSKQSWDIPVELTELPSHV